MVLDTEAWKALVNQLPGVLGAAFHVEEETVREVHILSDQSRTPKQVVRDVQSALLAKFQLELDHRIISVAQIPAPLKEGPRRLVFERLDMASSRDGVSVKVHLRLGDRLYEGESRCAPSSGTRTRAIAAATVEAINCLLASNCRFSVEAVRTTALAEHPVVMVGLFLKLDGKTESLLGACYVGDDVNFSVILATLDAVNRRLLTLPPSSDSLL